MDQSSSFPMPPGPFQDFEFSFGSSSSNANFMPPSGPPPPPGPLHFDFNFPTGHDQKDDMFHLNMMASQTPLLSPNEQTNILGFLDAFDWDFNPTLPQGMPTFNPPRMGRSTVDHSVMATEADPPRIVSMRGLPSSAVQENPGARAILDVATLQHHPQHPHKPSLPQPPNSEVKTSPSVLNPPPHNLHSASSTPSQISIQPAPKDDDGLPSRPTKRRKSSPSLISVDLSGAVTPPSSEKVETPAPARKPLLTQPQKRLNHIMSEQRRRNAIKEGYATIEKLIAPVPEYAGPLPTLSSANEDKGGPTTGKVRGRSRGKGRGKGKMGTLFRAVEYCQFLEESVAALRVECERLEGITRMIDPRTNTNHPFNHMSVGPNSQAKLDALFKFSIPMD